MTAAARGSMPKQVLGVDVGGSGIKGSPVDIKTGKLLAERHRIPTPEGAKPEEVAAAVADLCKHFEWTGPMGCTFPAAMKAGVAYTAANVDASWIGTSAAVLFQEATGCPTMVINDADAAGVAEMRFGAGRGEQGVVMMLTFGTGIGTALFTQGVLLPNTELGHLQVRGKDAEHRAAARIRTESKLTWDKWAKRVNEVLAHYEFLFWPDLFIIGGGVSRKHEKFLDMLTTEQARIVPATLQNNAGIAGAAALAAETLPRE